MRERGLILMAGVIAAGFLLSGCGSILVRPAVDKVKTVALVSVYMNRDFYDVKAPRSTDGTNALKTLGRAVLKETKVMDKLENAFMKEHQKIISYGVKVYSEKLDGAGGWRLMPVTTVIRNAKYQNFYGLIAKRHPAGGLVKAAATVRSADWFTVPGMIHFPIDSVAKNGTHIYAGDAKDPQEEARKALAKLCAELNVDAVALVEFDMGYQKPMIGLKLIGDDPAIPNISSALVLVNRDGEVAVNTGLISRGQGKRYEGSKVGMLRKGYVHLDDKGVDAYCQAIEKSADDMRKKLDAAFSKIK